LVTIRQELCTAAIGDILDQLGLYRQFLPPNLRPLQPDLVLAGRAMPVRLVDVFGPQDKPFGLLTEVLDLLQPDEIYVAGGSRALSAAWGEILTAAARARGAAGAVVDGYHRDTHKVVSQNWPVFSRGPYALDAAVRVQVQAFQVPIEIGAALVRPGDLMVGDIDGVVVIPQGVEDEVLERALAKARTENLVRRSIEAGMSATEAFRTFGVL
jgi:4-hydroxy-4-methyl-2-oxoglutarate aldolase